MSDPPVTLGTLSNPLTLKALSAALWPVLGGGVLAILLGHRGLGMRVRLDETVVVAIIEPARRAMLDLAGLLERVDHMLRQWPAAGLSLLVVAILFAAAMLAAG